MRDQTKAVAVMLLCTVFTSLGQLLWKVGVERIDLSSLLTFFNLPFLLGFVLYLVSAGLMFYAFSKGELSVLYPIVATSYVWVSLLSPFLFADDSMNWFKWAGVIVIL